MVRRKRRQYAERDDKGGQIRVRVSTTITAENHNWVTTNRGAQFGAILDRAITAIRSGDELPAESGIPDLINRATRCVVAARNRNGVPTEDPSAIRAAILILTGPRP